MRSTEAKLGGQHPDVLKLRADLRASVQEALQARQQLHRAELAEFQRRMQRIQHSIEARERIADKIVERRVEELLDPDHQWDPADEVSDASRQASPVAEDSSTPDAILKRIRPQDWGEANQGLRIAVVPGVENCRADEALALSVVLKNESQLEVSFQDNGWCRDIDLTVRHMTGAQVETLPRANSGYSQPHAMILQPGESTIIAVCRIRVITTVEIPNVDAELLILDRNAFQFRNEVYTVSCSLTAELSGESGARVPLSTSTIGIAFSRPAASGDYADDRSHQKDILSLTDIKGEKNGTPTASPVARDAATILQLLQNSPRVQVAGDSRIQQLAVQQCTDLKSLSVRLEEIVHSERRVAVYQHLPDSSLFLWVADDTSGVLLAADVMEAILATTPLAQLSDQRPKPPRSSVSWEIPGDVENISRVLRTTGGLRIGESVVPGDGRQRWSSFAVVGEFSRKLEDDEFAGRPRTLDLPQRCLIPHRQAAA